VRVTGPLIAVPRRHEHRRIAGPDIFWAATIGALAAAVTPGPARASMAAAAVSLRDQGANTIFNV
jgi:hypothetical protein